MPQILKNNCVVILGMHRSGTSCLAGALQQAGLYLGDVSIQNKFNRKGNREHSEIMRLNDDILSYNLASWDNPPLKSIKWTNKHEERAKKIISSFSRNALDAPWGFKDPRVLLTLPFWEKTLDNPTYIGTFRHPLNVVQSLQKRDSNNVLTFENALALWKAYNQHLINHHHLKPFRVISFDISDTKYQQELDEISISLSLTKTKDFFTSALRTQETNNIDLPQHIQKSYSILNSLIK